MNFILTAGAASRMGDRAPATCKALADVDGKPAIEHQLDVLGSATIVCRSVHVDLLKQYGPTVVDDSLGGPAAALLAGMRKRVDEPVTVLYADTLLDELPTWAAWCGVATTKERREWDVVAGGLVFTSEADPGGSVVCVGAYRFRDPWRLLQELAWTVGSHCPAGLGSVVNQIKLPFVEIPSWRDVS